MTPEEVQAIAELILLLEPEGQKAVAWLVRKLAAPGAGGAVAQANTAAEVAGVPSTALPKP